MSRPRVGLLHGYGQTPESFKEKSKSIQKSLGSRCDLIYLRGPHAVTNFKGEPGRAWWTFENESEFFTTTTYRGIEESIELVRQEAPLDGFIGFSQGAAFAALLCGLFSVKFCIIIGGYSATDPLYQPLYEKIGLTKFLHVYGEQDEIVVPERSRTLYELCGTEKQLVVHKGRHVIPKLKEYREMLS